MAASKTKTEKTPSAKTSAGNAKKAGQETMEFQAEVGRLLEIFTHALYSKREVFVRELISNAADACDRLRYNAIEKPELVAGDSDFAIEISLDKKAGQLVISDNGIGMDRDDLVAHLGTIARSGTGRFLDALSGNASKDVNLIGQFGVGFYAAFMVADQVRVVSHAAGAKTAHFWESDGKSAFVVGEAERTGPFKGRGTDVILTLKDDAKEFLDEARIKTIVTTYSNHIPLPIRFQGADDAAPAPLNEAIAPWAQPKGKLTAQQHAEFYRHCSHSFDEPWETIHFKTEGLLEYAGLLYVPSQRPFDLFNPERVNKLKLYVKKVFITDHCEELVPGWLRFLRGVIDSQDLPLNVSREMLQNNPVIGKIRNGVVKKVLDALKKRAVDDEPAFLEFWQNFGLVLKEGLCESLDEKEKQALMALCRFRSTALEPHEWTSLAAYKERMKPGQKSIYYITGQDPDALLKSPHLEGFRERGIEVLIFGDAVDDFWVGYQSSYQETPLASVTRAGDDLENFDNQDQKDEKGEKTKPENKETGEYDDLLKAMEAALSGKVVAVKTSRRLKESPVCLVSGKGGPDLHLERVLKMHNQAMAMPSQLILEINPDHELIKALVLKAKQDKDKIADIAGLVYDQARLLEGELPEDTSAFVKRVSHLLAKDLSS